MQLEKLQLMMAIGCSGAVAERWLEPLNAAMARFHINTTRRVAHFLAQIGHESIGLTATAENLNYSAEALARTWPNRYAVPGSKKPNAVALSIARSPEKIANRTYASRMGNGDVASGDGWRYRGRGPIQTTGRDNYAALNKALQLPDVDFLKNPEKVAEPLYGALAAGHYWHSHGLNELADTGTCSAITRRVNGGVNGLTDRQERLKRTCTVLAIPAAVAQKMAA